MQPATAKYNIPNGWDNHMIYLYFSCIASQNIKEACDCRHLSCKLKHAIATYDTFKNPLKKNTSRKTQLPAKYQMWFFCAAIHTKLR
jgi:hypothetical protein